MSPGAAGPCTDGDGSGGDALRTAIAFACAAAAEASGAAASPCIPCARGGAASTFGATGVRLVCDVLGFGPEGPAAIGIAPARGGVRSVLETTRSPMGPMGPVLLRAGPFGSGAEGALTRVGELARDDAAFACSIGSVFTFT